MKLNKAIKREKSSNKAFFILMTFLLICLPFVYYLFQRSSSILTIYLVLLELLILFSIANKVNNIYIRYEVKNNVIKLKDGIIKEYNLIYCEKIKLIHTFNKGSDMEIIIISTHKFRNKGLKALEVKFLKRHSEIEDFYNKNRILYPEELYYYQIIKNGNLKKYDLLSYIFKTCVKAEYTKSAIDNIKIAREQEEF